MIQKTVIAAVLAMLLITPLQAATQYRKPGAAVELLAPRVIQLVAGESQEITLTFSAPKPGRSLELQLVKISGVQLLTNESSWQFDGEPAQITLRLAASTPGKYRLQFMATTWPRDNPEETLVRALGVAAVVSGTVGQQKLSGEPVSRKLEIRSDGTRTVQFMAEETIR